MRRVLSGAALTAALGCALAAPPAIAAPLTLQLWPAGQGRIEVSQGGVLLQVRDSVDNIRPSCDFLDVVSNPGPCTVAVDSATPVTLTAVVEPGTTIPPAQQNKLPDFPVSAPAFVRWSRYDCGSSTTCTFTPDTNLDWVTAVFTPLQLQVGINGAGTVGVRRPGGIDQLTCPPSVIDFGEKTCFGLRPAGADVVLVATPTPPSDSVAWGPGCEPAGGNIASPTCTVSMTNVRTFAAVAFRSPADPVDVQPPFFPFQISPQVRVLKGGTGQGTVRGSGITCGTQCSSLFGYQDRVSLTAEAAQGSRFVRWVGVCSTNPACAFSAGSATVVQALFDTASASSSPSSGSQSPSSPSSGTKSPSTRPGSTQPNKPFRLRLAGIRTTGHGARRTVAIAVVTDRSARVRVRMLKRRRTIAVRTFQVSAGRHTLRLRVPRSARPGLYRLRISFASKGASRTLTRSVRLRR